MRRKSETDICWLKRCGPTVVTFLIVVCARTAAAAPVDVPAWAVAFLQSWYSAYNDGDATKLAALYSTDAFLAINNGHNGVSAATDGPSIGASLVKESQKNSRTCRGEFDGVRELGTLAVAWGHDTCLQKASDPAVPKELHRRWLRVLVPTKSNQWIATRDEIEDIQMQEAKW